MYHVYPVNDEKEHILDGTTCPCDPEIDWDLGIVTHNSWDGREFVERAEQIKSDVSREIEENIQ